MLPAEPTTPTPPPYASWISRVGAILIDGIVYLGVTFAVIAALVATNLAEEDTERLEEGELGDAWLALLYAGFLLGPLVYSTLLHGAYGKTLGKMALGIRVVREDDLGAIGYRRAFGRALAVLVLGVIPFAGILDGLWPLWDTRNQAIHDKIASTVVVRSSGAARRRPRQRRRGATGLPAAYRGAAGRANDDDDHP